MTKSSKVDRSEIRPLNQCVDAMHSAQSIMRVLFLPINNTRICERARCHAQTLILIIQFKLCAFSRIYSKSIDKLYMMRFTPNIEGVSCLLVVILLRMCNLPKIENCFVKWRSAEFVSIHALFSFSFTLIICLLFEIVSYFLS